MKPFLKAVSLSLVFAGSLSLAPAQTTVTFDSLSPGNDWVLVPNGYGDLQWYNFGALNGTIQNPAEGYYRGVISTNNVAFNLGGNSGALLYDNTYTLSPTGAVFVQFNYIGVDSVNFNAGSQFVMDNLTTSAYTTNDCTFTISPFGATHGFNSETGSVSVATSSNCTWTVVNNNSWITILSGLTNTGSGTVLYQVDSNSTALVRSGNMSVAGQTFAIRQVPYLPTNGSVDVGDLVVSSLGHTFSTFRSSRAADYFIDQDQSSGGGGGVLGQVAVDWNVSQQFTLTVSAPPGKKFVVHVPTGQSAKFGGFLWWNSSGGGFSPYGPVLVTFTGLQGTAPDFSGSDAVLADSHGYFGFVDIDSTPFTSDIAFSSIQLTGLPSPQYTASGALNFTPHNDSSLSIVCTTSGTDPGPFVTIESEVGQLRVAPPPEMYAGIDENGDCALTFTGILQWSADPNGPFEDVPDHPLGSYVIPKAGQSAQQFFRTRSN